MQISVSARVLARSRDVSLFPFSFFLFLLPPVRVETVLGFMAAVIFFLVREKRRIHPCRGIYLCRQILLSPSFPFAFNRNDRCRSQERPDNARDTSMTGIGSGRNRRRQCRQESCFTINRAALSGRVSDLETTPGALKWPATD
jgi:hypothetical protein